MWGWDTVRIGSEVGRGVGVWVPENKLKLVVGGSKLIKKRAGFVRGCVKEVGGKSGG